MKIRMKRWQPEEGKWFYYADRFFDIRFDYWHDFETEKYKFMTDNCFRTKTQAQEFLRRSKKLAMEYHKEIKE